jgi:hypothetical protein
MSLLILVPQGAEYQAICQGLKSWLHPPQVRSIPVGVAPVQRVLRSANLQNVSGVVVMGLCGSLSPRYQIGDAVIYHDCIDGSGTVKVCDRSLTQRLQNGLKVSPVRALTSDRVIWSALEKRDLGKTHGADVVDMEGMAVMSLNLPIAMVRVVSDDVQHDLPDLSGAIDESGTLRSLPLATRMLRQPLKSLRLIRGSLAGLRSLQTVTQQMKHCLDGWDGEREPL